MVKWILRKGLIDPLFGEIRGSRQAWPGCRQAVLGLAMWLLVSCVFAQTPPGSVQEKKPPTPAAAAPSAPPVTPSAPPLAAAPEPAPERPPVITWDGKLLTIDAENSSLEQILIAIRAQTNATMEIPPSAASERVALHIGPASVRDVLSTLLYGSSFDYVIQSADDDPDGLRSLILTARGQADDSADAPAVAANAAGVGTGVAKPPNARMMKGWAAPGKTAAQAAAEAALAAQKAAAEEAASNGDSSSSASSTPPDSGSPAAPAESDSSKAANNSNNPDAQSAAAANSSNDTSGITVSDIPPNSADATSSSGNGSEEKSEVSQKMQDMMHLFEQRKQIQALQNQVPSQPQPSN